MKLTTELDFVLCEVSACVPGDKHCEPCMDPDDACSSRLDTYSSETLALPMNITYAVYNPIFIGYTVERLVMPTPLCGRDARPRPARSARDGHTDRLRVVARELHRRLGRGALDALHVQAGRRDDWAAECGAAGDERRGVQRARRVSDQAAGRGVELPDGAGRVAVRGLVQLCRPGPGPRGARLVLEGVGRQVRRARERARPVRL